MAIKVFDFFSGCGGTSAGLKAAGMDIILGLDFDADAKQTFTANFPEATFIQKDITEMATEDLQSYIELARAGGEPLLFSGCAPCQPFSGQNRSHKNSIDNKKRFFLLGEFGRFISHYRPEFVFVENVPAIKVAKRQEANCEELSPFWDFHNLLEDLGYHTEHAVISAQDFGVPQCRKRLVLVASLIGEAQFPNKTHGPDRPNRYSWVRDWIGDLPSIEAGEQHSDIPNHRAASLSQLNLERIRATPQDGGRRMDWPERLQLNCHRPKDDGTQYDGHTDVYGRMRWEAPASGLTTRCISLSNGRFGHPEQARAISVREAACLQTFPIDFVFHGSLNSMARQIGNAVPVLLAQRFGECFNEALAAAQAEGTENGKVQNPCPHPRYVRATADC